MEKDFVSALSVLVRYDRIALGIQDLRAHSLWTSWDRDSGFRHLGQGSLPRNKIRGENSKGSSPELQVPR